MPVSSNTFTPTPLSFVLSSFAASPTSPLLTPVVASNGVTNVIATTYDCIATVNMSLANAQNLFQYEYDNNGSVRLYLDQTQFIINYTYPYNVGSFALTETDYLPSPYPMSNSTQTFTNPNLQWIGPVTSGGILTSTTTPLTWDFLQFLMQELYDNTYPPIQYVSNIFSLETTLRTNINSTVNNIILPILAQCDKNTVPVTGNITKSLDTNGKYYVTLNNNPTFNSDILSGIYNYMYINQPERFNPNSSTNQNELFSYPFIVGDNMCFIISVTSSNNQSMYGGALTSQLRRYLVQITIST